MINKEHIINDQIRVKEVRLIGENGDQLGVVATNSAKEMAYNANLDLVLISPAANPPVAKIMDYGRFKYEQDKKIKEQKKAQKEKIVELKEIWLSATIDTNDMNTKANNAIKFLKAGDKVRASIRLKGRQMARPEIGVKVMEEFFELVKEFGVMEKQPNLD
ncbi:MAG: translation initiation factor IF-3, partial [Clostridia bacterium]|nr:translation initiation factor IF-3 [Clostridia bacterium]